MANSTAEFLATWKGFLKDFKDAGKAAFNEQSIAPIKDFVKNIKEKNRQLKESYDSIADYIARYEKKLKASTDKKYIELYALKLEELNKALAKHPGKPQGGSGGDKKEGKSGGGLLSTVADLFSKSNPVGKLADKIISSGVKRQQELAEMSPHAPSAPGKGVRLHDPVIKAGMSMNPASLGMAGIEKTTDAPLQTVAEKWDQFNEKLKSGLGDVGLAFMPLLNRLLDFGLTLIDKLLPQIMQFVQPIMDILNSLPLEDILYNVMNVVTAILGAVGPIIEELKPLFDALFEAFNPLLESVGGLIIALAEGLGPVLGLIVHIAVAVLGPVVKGLAKAFSWLVDIVTAIVEFVSPIIEFITRAIGLIVDGVMKMFGLDNEKNGTIGFYRDEKSSVSVTDAALQNNTGLLKAADHTSKTKNAAVNTQANKTAGDITSGGPRVININGVKFTDKIELHILSAKEGLNELEAHMQEMFLRILNSGAALK